jgi:hypothetical protein
MQLFAKSQERSCKSWFFEIARVLVRFYHGHSHLSICVVERNDALDASVAMWRATCLEQ